MRFSRAFWKPLPTTRERSIERSWQTRQALGRGRRRLLVEVLLAALALLGLLAWILVRDDHPARSTAAPATTARRERALPRALTIRRLVLGGRLLRPLNAPLQDTAAASVGSGHVLLVGGLTAADTSSDSIRSLGPRGDVASGRLPGALHDSAAVPLGRAAYLFGGGNGTAQLDGILRVERSGRVADVGRLPAPSSDQAAAALAGTAYVVGGFTGTRWLDSIVAWRPGEPARVVAHLPTPVRYAAVTAAGGRIVIAGGSLPSGAATAAVYAYRPGTRIVRRVATLPAPTTHAAAASLGGLAYVVGGRGATLNTPTARIVAIDPLTGRSRPAGRLRAPLSDAAAVTAGNRILVVGGRSRDGTVATITQLTPRLLRPAAAPHAPAATRATRNVYAADRSGDLTGGARFARPLVYVPNSESNTVDEIDPRTFRVVRHFAVGLLPQHVVPSYDLKTLYVANDLGNSLTVINPRTGRRGRTIRVADPYNMYFTPDGRYAIVVAEQLNRLDFRDAHSFRLHHSLHLPCRGADHMDFSADGAYAIVSCEFSSQLLKVDVAGERVVGRRTLPRGAVPQDVKLSPDGRVFYVADTAFGGVWEVDGDSLRVLGFVHTGAGAHGLYASRDARYLYVTNRRAGSISLISFAKRRVATTWRIPGGGSPDMGNVSADGKVLWLTGRYDAEVYAISTRNGRLLARIHVGLGPHGLCVWPQPGRYSLGHTGILR
jgi:DNA-binding beta-propeller fold protein YncE